MNNFPARGTSTDSSRAHKRGTYLSWGTWTNNKSRRGRTCEAQTVQAKTGLWTANDTFRQLQGAWPHWARSVRQGARHAGSSVPFRDDGLRDEAVLLFSFSFPAPKQHIGDTRDDGHSHKTHRLVELILWRLPHFCLYCSSAHVWDKNLLFVFRELFLFALSAF